MYELCLTRLLSLGYTYNATTDDSLLNYLILKTQNFVKIECNISTIPAELNNFIADYTVGEFLMNKKNMGLLDITAVDLDLAEKSVALGDTKVEYNIDGCKTQEQRFDELIKKLMSNNDGLIVAYRTLRW